MRNPLTSFVCWLGFFLLLSLPILADLGSGLAAFPNPNDARLVVWILDWAWYALTHAPSTIYDAPINYPASAQLTGSDWFFSAQLIFAPLRSFTGNPLLAANLTAWFTYPLAAFLMERLLRRLDCTPLASVVGGLFFALASRRAPFNVHILQNANFLLPLVALSLDELRQHTDLRRAFFAAAAFLLAMLSALYGAFFSAVIGIVFLLFELCRSATRRPAYLGLALGAAAAAAIVALALLAPWTARSASEFRPLVTWEPGLKALASPLLGATKRDALSFTSFLPVVALLPATWLALRSRRGAAIALVGVLLWALGALLAPGFPRFLAPALEDSPLAFLAYPIRFQIIADFGRTVVLALGLSALGTPPLPLFIGRTLGVVALFVILSTRGLLFLGGEFLLPSALAEHAPAYTRVAAVAAAGHGGPLLELPLRIPTGDEETQPTAPDSMLGQLTHRVPLIDGYTGYHPRHRGFVLDAVGRLPSATALDDLLRATELRWVLLRPLPDWRGHQPPRSVIHALLAKSPRVATIHEFHGFTLAQLRDPPDGTDWSEEIRRGTDHTQTALGGRVENFVGKVDAKVSATWVPKAPERTPSFVRILVAVENRTDFPLPASIPASRALMLDFGTDQPRGLYQEGLLQRASPFPVDREIALTAQWVPRKPKATEPEVLVVPLPRDVAPGETLEFWTLLWQPNRAGRYTLRLRLAQIEKGIPRDLGIEGFDTPIRIRKPGPPTGP